MFSIPGRGTVVTGRVERGVINKGATLEILGQGQRVSTTLTGIEMFHKELERGEAGDNMGALLRGVKREQIARGQVLTIPGTIESVKKFKSNIYVRRRRHYSSAPSSHGNLTCPDCFSDSHQGGGRSLHALCFGLRSSDVLPHGRRHVPAHLA